MTRRYDVGTGKIAQDTGPGATRERLVPGWHVPGPNRYHCDIRVGDAERDHVMAQLREHFVAGRLALEELTERLGFALAAKTRGQIEDLMADLPRLPGTARPPHQASARGPDVSRFVVFAMLLFVLATWLLVLAWVYRHAGWRPPYPPGPGGSGP